MTGLRFFGTVSLSFGVINAEPIKAGVGRANITNKESGTIVNYSLYVKANLGLLKNHQKSFELSEDKLLHAELNGLKIGDFVLVTFPGELSNQNN